MNKLTILRVAAATWVVMLLITAEARPASSGLHEPQSQCYAIGIYRKCAWGLCNDEQAAAWAGPADTLLATRTPIAIQQCAAHMVQMVMLGNSVPGSMASIMSPCAVYCTPAAFTGLPSSSGQGTAGSSGAKGLTVDQILQMQEERNRMLRKGINAIGNIK
jgi:hypothetical protein